MSSGHFLSSYNQFMPHYRIATGHQTTSQAADEILRAGGNAVDAAIGALLTACVAEPMLASLGGGGHALIQTQEGTTACLDFFAQTPRQKHPGALNFYPIVGNFGTDTQEFHVGLASIATPGVMAGLDALHQRYGSVSKHELIEPAKRAAIEGVALNALQHHTLEILEPIVRASHSAARWAGLDSIDSSLPPVGHLLCQPRFADFLDQWVKEGEVCFYQGELAHRLVEDSQARGGHLRHDDLTGYEAKWRTPLQWRYRDALIWSNPPPAFGGMMLALSTLGLERHLAAHTTFGSVEHIQALIQTMVEVNEERLALEASVQRGQVAELEKQFQTLIQAHAPSRRGTTHISIDDGKGSAIAMTVSNGEGSGYVLEDAGIMMNNMLGEEDINRGGFHQWPNDQRLSSMMTPTIVHYPNGHARYLLGSGGSNRIRTALMQVLCNLVDFGMDLEEAIAAPRMHLEADHLSIELASEWSDETQTWLLAHHRNATTWPSRSLFFGGVHATGPHQASADARREGKAISASINSDSS